jgi:hypothetical protein
MDWNDAKRISTISRLEETICRQRGEPSTTPMTGGRATIKAGQPRLLAQIPTGILEKHRCESFGEKPQILGAR